MTVYQHHIGVARDYQQDYINGITSDEYNALFLELANIKTRKNSGKIKLIEIGGGTGNLALQLQERGFEILLTDTDEGLLNVALERGVSNTRKLDILYENNPIKTVFDVVIMKSVQHEFPLEKLTIINKNIYKLLTADGIFFEWDAHVENNAQAVWLKNYVNLKDSLAGDAHLVENRHIYTVQEIARSLEDAGFREVSVVYRFYYSLSNNKFSDVYFRTDAGVVDENKKKEFYEVTKTLVQKVPVGIGLEHDQRNENFIFKIPAVIIKASR